MPRPSAPWLVALAWRAGNLLSSRAGAATILSVDLSTTVRPATHVANGSLYGVIENVPADGAGLIAPLHPRMFTNPAAVGAGKQQPWGDAILVAQRVAPMGATVTLRLADWFPGWYSFTNMSDWFDKMSQAVARKKAAGLTNVYAYEIWNEPNGTWTTGKPMSFNEFWRQSYEKLRALDPDVKITGPSAAGYDESLIKDFLTFCKANDCLPDIVGWHDGQGIGRNVQSYRAMEKGLPTREPVLRPRRLRAAAAPPAEPRPGRPSRWCCWPRFEGYDGLAPVTPRRSASVASSPRGVRRRRISTNLLRARGLLLGFATSSTTSTIAGFSKEVGCPVSFARLCRPSSCAKP